MALKTSRPHPITKMTQGFNEDMKFLMALNSLHTYNKVIVCNQEAYTKISDSLHKMYMSGSVSLTYFVKNFQPGLSNALCEL